MTDLLAIDPGYDDFSRARRRDRDPLRNGIGDVMAVTKLDLQVFSLYGRTIADAADFKPAFEPFGDPGNRVLQQRAPPRVCIIASRSSGSS